MPVEFELDDHRASISGDKDDDASSVSSVIIAASHSDHRGKSVEREISPPAFWPKKEGRCEEKRAAPPRYMITGALDSTIRLWDTHFRPNSDGAAPFSPPPSEPEGEGEHGDWSRILPTDPLTNSHTPRAAACVRTFFGHVEGIWALSADHLRLVSGSEDRMMKVWDPRTGKCERTFTGHQGPVTCAWLSDSRVASGSEDCEVRMLCFGGN
jgi:F-box/WD-40 domain protein MET30